MNRLLRRTLRAMTSIARVGLGTEEQDTRSMMMLNTKKSPRLWTRMTTRVHAQTAKRKRASRSSSANNEHPVARRSSTRLINSKPRPMCPKCGDTFNRSADVARHLRDTCRKNPLKRTRYPCPFCPKTYSSKDAMKRHVKDKKCPQGESLLKTRL
ncbi:hypothetical protein OBBRIDRAFT_354842 [Obba rivulosa]|uniref:C2H2-type domain-containing protein n=1 Tax=Obba rivulosa TaxID=1052685 RepID=A0A8E2DP85_9APHY|nr:hypothetical protein OBBRIDRAFT_354842 [Obba rivulosa]